MELNKVYQGDALEVLGTFPPRSVNCCVTSPPYSNQRDYEAEGQIGAEKHYSIYIKNLCNIFDQVSRVLINEGTLFVNLGDTYNGNKAGNTSKKGYKENTIVGGFTKERNELPLKSLCMLPERFAIEMLNRGWVLRNQIIWHKPNQMPQSAKDRFTVDFEKVFFFTKQSKGYYFKQQLEPYESKPQPKRNKNIEDSNSGYPKGDRFSAGERDYYSRGGRNVRTVWSVNTQPLKEAHFAAYPEKLVERCLLAGCPEGGIVLDPFSGANTTGLVALKNSRSYIGIELNPAYIEIGNKRVEPYMPK